MRAVLIVLFLGLSLSLAAAATTGPAVGRAAPLAQATATPTLAGYTYHRHDDLGVLCLIYQGQVNAFDCLAYTPTPTP